MPGKSCDITEMVGSMCLFILLVTSTTSQQCSKAVRSIKGKYLTGHVISSGNADGLGDCLIKCAEDPRCKSVNFGFKDLLCELNDADRYTHPWDYGSREGHAYSDYPFKVKTCSEFEIRCLKRLVLFTINFNIVLSAGK